MRRASTQVLPKKDALTDSQLKVLRVIRDHIKNKQISPTYEEIAAQIDRAKTPVRQTITLLMRKGMLEKAPGRFRNLIVTDKGLAAARDGRRRRK